MVVQKKPHLKVLSTINPKVEKYIIGCGEIAFYLVGYFQPHCGSEYEFYMYVK